MQKYISLQELAVIAKEILETDEKKKRTYMKNLAMLQRVGEYTEISKARREFLKKFAKVEEIEEEDLVKSINELNATLKNKIERFVEAKKQLRYPVDMTSKVVKKNLLEIPFKEEIPVEVLTVLVNLINVRGDPNELTPEQISDTELNVTLTKNKVIAEGEEKEAYEKISRFEEKTNEALEGIKEFLDDPKSFLKSLRGTKYALVCETLYMGQKPMSSEEIEKERGLEKGSLRYVTIDLYRKRKESLIIKGDRGRYRLSILGNYVMDALLQKPSSSTLNKFGQ